jgi:hypothetical protein
VDIRIEVDTAPIKAVLATLRPPAFNEVAALALNATAKNAEVEAAQVLRPLMGIKSSDLKAAMRIELARPDHLASAVIASGKAIPMIKFRPRVSRTQGVTITVAGKAERYRHAFRATVRHGHIGIFERKGRERLPIRELYGPSIPGMLRRTDVLPVILDTMSTRLVANLMRQIDRRARREAGHYGGA